MSEGNVSALAITLLLCGGCLRNLLKMKLRANEGTLFLKSSVKGKIRGVISTFFSSNVISQWICFRTLFSFGYLLCTPGLIQSWFQSVERFLQCFLSFSLMIFHLSQIASSKKKKQQKTQTKQTHAKINKNTQKPHKAKQNKPAQCRLLYKSKKKHIVAFVLIKLHCNIFI